ncbi:MAG: hypothetical protein QM773_07005 [Hyphomonadaceae bacterium]
MNSLRILLVAGATWFAAGAPSAYAQNETKTYALEEALQVCARVSDATARLSCFEELARNVAPKPAIEPSASSRASADTPTGKAETLAPDKESKSRFVVMRADEFEKEKSRNDRPADKPRTTYEATVLRAWQYGNGEYHIALANGEIWKSQARDSPRPVKEGEKVELQPGAVGSWFMHFKTLKRPAIRVTRLE